jgi:phosphodiesterase/alkaline phosphatase D-like protein
MQLYNDNVWHAGSVKRWIEMEDKQAMRATPLNQQQAQDVDDFYFFAYVRWLKFHPLGEDLANIPMMNTWDDHDIFDGWGSYPDHLQSCATFQQVFTAAKRYFTIFQLHTTDRMKRQDGYFSGTGENGCSWMSQLGPKLAVVALDTRSSRTRERIVPEKLLKATMNRIATLPGSVQHLLFVSAVPVAYPEMSAMEAAMKAGEGDGLLVKTGTPGVYDVSIKWGQFILSDHLLVCRNVIR